MERNELISYAIDFASYLIANGKKIDRIILHGSVARGDFDENSDIDLFVDSREDIEKMVNNLVERYYKTRKFREWELKGIKNQISVISGNLEADEWKDLKRGIMNTGVILYGKYKAQAEKINQYTIFSFENIKPENKRVLIFRKLFGFKIGKKSYPGMADKLNASKIGKGALVVPSEYVNELKSYFNGKKVPVKLYDVWSDSKIE